VKPLFQTSNRGSSKNYSQKLYSKVSNFSHALDCEKEHTHASSTEA